MTEKLKQLVKKLFDPKNAHRFSAAAAVKAFAHVKVEKSTRD